MDSGIYGLVALVLAGILGSLTFFQLLIAIGSPLGEWAYGGFHKGVLPLKLRVSSAIAVLLWAGAVLLVLDVGGHINVGIDPEWRSRMLMVLLVLMGLGSVLNAISKSRKERLLWTPVSAVSFLLSLVLLLGH